MEDKIVRDEIAEEGVINMPVHVQFPPSKLNDGIHLFGLEYDYEIEVYQDGTATIIGTLKAS